jgi:xanthosine utilization system XapX-like protein
MAGNPYTETGEKFRIPDMLANRADTYNLGDISGGRGDVFGLSFLENALTANPTTLPLAARDPTDVHLLIRLAQGEPVATTDLKHGYSGAEIDELVRVFQKLLKVQAVLLKVNAAYVASAATDDRFRTEPPFKLQGSYRNMAKLAQGIVPVMNDDELERLIDDHYKGESQTLTTGAEANLLKLGALRGRLSPDQAARWADIRRNFERIQLQGDSNDPATRVAGTLASLTQRIDDISASITQAATVAREAATTTQQRFERATTQAVEAQTAAQAQQAAQTAAALTQASEAIGSSLQALGVTLGSSVGATLAQTWSSSLHDGAGSLGSQLVHALTAQAQTLVQGQREIQRDVAAGADERAARVIAAQGVPRHDDTVANAITQLSATLTTTVMTALQQAQWNVQIDNPAPPGIAELVRLQTILIEASLLPLVRGLASSLEHEKENANRLEAALQALRALEQKGVAVATTTTEPHRPFKPRAQGTRVKE